MPQLDAETEAGPSISRQDVLDRLHAIDMEGVHLRAQLRAQQERGYVEVAGRQPVPLQITQVQGLPPVTVSPGIEALPAATKAAGTPPALRGQAKSSAPPPVDEGFHDAGSTIAAC